MSLIGYAKTIVRHSCKVRPGDNVLIMSEGLDGIPLVAALIDEVYGLGASPFPEVIDTGLHAAFQTRCNEAQMAAFSRYTIKKLDEMDVVIVISALESKYCYNDVPADGRKLFNLYFMEKCFYEHVAPGKRWIFLKYPNNGLAIGAGMSLAGYQDFYFQVCGLDYPEMSRRMDPLAALMRRTDRVRILGPGTDIRFSIKGMPVVKCDGDNSLPDGEVFTAPLRESVCGHITFNCPLISRGTLFEGVRLTVENGYITGSETANNAAMTAILDTDTGSRFFGEFALGVNPHMTVPTRDTLFDEKMAGSLHFALGNSLHDAFNGNSSLIHVDMVCIQTPRWGGGEIWFDDVLIRKDGLFVPEALKPLDMPYK